MLIFLAAWGVAGLIMASQMGQGKLYRAYRLASADAQWSRHSAHSSLPTANDDVTHFSARLQTIQVLPSSACLLPMTLMAIPGTEKDLLSLTQRRRE
jgi:hypothetical protein